MLAAILVVICCGAWPGPASPADAAAAHEQISCQKCHQGSSGSLSARERDACLACHRDQLRSRLASDAGDTSATARYAALEFHSQPRRGCTSCHSFHQTDLVTTVAGPLDLVSAQKVDVGHCTTCHAKGARRENLNSAHVQAAALYHGRSAELIGTTASAGCLSCHDRNSGSAWKLETVEAPLTFSTHASHPIGSAVVPGSGPAGNRMREQLDPRIPLFNGRLECQTCHSLTAKTKDLLVGWNSPKEMCLGCHQLKSDRRLAESRTDDLRPVLLGTMVK